MAAAITGISLVCGENVCGIDPKLERGPNGQVTKSPEMKRRLDLYRRYHEGYGDILVQLNVEDSRLGVAEYVLSELGVETIEIKWGQGAKSIGGEIKVNSLERALDLKSRGYIVTPDPEEKGRTGRVPLRRDQRIRAPFPAGLCGAGKLHENRSAPARTRRKTSHPQDRRLPDARAGHGDSMVFRRENRPSDH